MLPLNKLTREEVAIVVHYGWRCRLEKAARQAIMYQMKCSKRRMSWRRARSWSVQQRVCQRIAVGF